MCAQRVVPWAAMPSSSTASRRAGFTLIELMLVIGVIAILSAIVIAALSPTRQLASGRNAKRQSDVNTILNAVYQYVIDHQGTLPQGIPQGNTPLEICTVTAGSCQFGVNLRVLTGAYLSTIPMDPQAIPTGTGTLYFIRRDQNSRLTVSAPRAEGSGSISITR